MTPDDQELECASIGVLPTAEPAVSALRDVVERLTAEVGLSLARARQLRWVAGELERALTFPDLVRVRSLADLLAHCDAYLALAQQGRLRHRATKNVLERESSKASMRVRRDCLLLLGRAAGIEVLIDFPLPRAEKSREFNGAYSVLQDLYWYYRYRGIVGYLELRAMAIACVVADTGARVSELCVMRGDDVSSDFRSIRVFRNPYFSPNSDPEVPEHLWLSPGGKSILEAWLPHQRWYAGPEKYLWITLRQSTSKKADGRRELRPVGSPLGPRAITEAHSKFVARGHVNLPPRLESLRRTARPRPVSPWGGRSL